MIEELFKKKIKELEDFRGNNNELITYFIPYDKDIDDARRKISNEISESENIKSKQTRKSVKSSLSHILNKLKWFKETPNNGMVVFVGETDDGRISEFIEPPKPLEISNYRCGSTFNIEPLKGMFQSNVSCGLAVISRGEACIGKYNGYNITDVEHIESDVPSKHKKGGFSQQRFERLNEEMTENFFNDVGDKMRRKFSDNENIIIGGHGKTKDDFAKKLRNDFNIIDKHGTNYSDESGLKELLDKAEDTLEKLEIADERKLVKKFMRMLKSEPYLVEYGEDKVKTSLMVGAVSDLLISEDLESDKILELKSSVEEKGGDAHIISTESPKGKIFRDTFGGIGAILRYSY